MAEIKIAGIMRAGAFSPNHIGNDAAIFNIVADQLRKRGCEVNVYSEERFIAEGVTEPIIVNMCREARSIEKLQQLEEAGALVINSGYGIENCIRERMARILPAAGIPYPESIVTDTDEVVKDRLMGSPGSFWVKRADSHTRHREDIAHARHAQEAQELLQEFFLRGIKRAVINRHIRGTQVKFYGVVGTPFFYWLAPIDEPVKGPGGEHAFSLPLSQSADQRPGTLDHFDPERLKALALKAADLLDIKIYGGDAAVADDGSITILDFDDWPSFAPCRHEAGPVIARMIMATIKSRQ